MPQQTLVKIKSTIEALPRISNVAIELIRVVDDYKSSREDVKNLLLLDQLLYARIFKYANSAAIAGSRGSINSLDRAIDVIGLNDLKIVAFTAAASTLFNDRNIWLRSLAQASYAKYFAKLVGMSRQEIDDIYIAGLLSTFGVFVLKANFGDEYTKYEQIKDFSLRLKAEKERFGINNLELASMMLQDCALPEQIYSLIRAHQNYEAEEFSKSNAIIEVARIFSELSDDLTEEDWIKVEENQELRSFITKHGLELIHFNQQTFDAGQEQVSRLAGAYS